MSSPTVPASLKQINIFLKTAHEIESRDPIVAYYCRLYALEKGMEIDKRSPEARNFLTQLMSQLEGYKKDLNQSFPEVFTPDSVVGQAAIENKALQLFSFADNKDRSSDFGPATVKAFYTAGVLLDVLQSFGIVNTEFDKCRKYAKWKALYITQCRKNGEVPVAGPLGEDGEEAPDFSALSATPMPQLPPQAHHPSPPAPQHPPNPPVPSPQHQQQPLHPPQQQPQHQPQPAPAQPAGPSGQRIQRGAICPSLTPENYTTAMKYCKYAGSALQYQDASTAIDYLVKSLNLLQSGKE